ncbi:MAG: 2-C-methyl-D-erythritol 2,4-cyclodiphosphate synthase, partial [Desulfococcus sp. 4484_242]
MFRIGFGYDVHRLVEGRQLVLGGVIIAHRVGLDGHSDADVLIHAVIDAVLGALGSGDIGQHFPDADPAYRGISSLVLLERTAGLMRDMGFQLNNLDATVVAQEPRLGSHIPTMRENLGLALGAEIDRINIKATTSERLGFCGKQEGMEAFAV